jgi:hypothetical protein
MRRSAIAAIIAVLLLPALARAALVPAELRAGEDQATAPLVPLYKSYDSDRTSLALRRLTDPTLTVAGSGESVSTCTLRDYYGDFATPHLWRSNGPVVGDDLEIHLEPCSVPFPCACFARVEIHASGEHDSFRMRYETWRRHGTRDGVIEPAPEGPFTVTYWYWSRFVDEGTAACFYEFESPTRIDVYNKGHGHKVDFERERLTLTGEFSDPPVPCWETLELSLEGRLRGWGPKPGAASDWTVPVWIGPAATPAP